MDVPWSVKMLVYMLEASEIMRRAAGGSFPKRQSSSSSFQLSRTEIIGPLKCEAEIIADGNVAPINAPDGIVDVADILIMTQIVMGLLTPDTNTLAHGDIYPNGSPNGVITISDLLLLHQLVINN